MTNEYEERWRDLSRAVCVERGHDWHSWRGQVRCSTCGAKGWVVSDDPDRADDVHEPNEASRGY